MIKNYQSKILLFGEYTVLNGSHAFAVPCNQFSGRWSFDKKMTPEFELSSDSLKSFLNSVSHDCLQKEKFVQDLKDGIWFDSTIPHGYGLGSSGALIAAIYDRYGIHQPDMVEVKSVLARLEDHFHGASSGLDPLVSFIERPIYIYDFDRIEILNNFPKLDGFFILNSGHPRQTGPLVDLYKEKMKSTEFKKGCIDILQRDVNSAIQCLLHEDMDGLYHHFWHISKFQYDFFSEMIPQNTREVWTRGLDSGDYILKLCGAGGGGFLLGFSQKLNGNELKEKLSTFDLRELK